VSQVVPDAEEIAPLCYIAGPYGDAGGWVAIDRNIGVAREAAIWLVEHGFFFLCPHLNSAHFEHLTPDATIAHWYAQDLRLMEPCDAIVLVGKWPGSRGVNKERQVAAERGQPMFDFTDEKAREDLLAWRDQWIAKRLGIGLAQVVRDMAEDAPTM